MTAMKTRDRNRHYFSEFFKYLFSGQAAFVLDISILYSLTEWGGFNYLISAPIAFSMGTLSNYLLCIYWVFKNRTLDNRHLELGIFLLIGIIGLTLNEMFIWFFTETAGLHYLQSKVISALLVFFWHFLSKKIILFR